jgi:hypothetical protein
MGTAQALLSFFLTFLMQRFRFFLLWMRLHLANGLLADLLLRVVVGEPKGDSGGSPNWDSRLAMSDSIKGRIVGPAIRV